MTEQQTNAQQIRKINAPTPMAVDSANPVSWCQESIWLYPARWALTDSAFKRIQTSGLPPTLPTKMTNKGADYSLRRVRDGYIYMLTANSDCPTLPSTAQADGKSWYIYRCRSDNYNQYFYQWTKAEFEQWQNTDNPAGFVKHLIEQTRKRGKTHIELNRAVGIIHIMYSDFILPNELLHRIAINEAGARDLWMKTIPIDGSSDGNMTADIKDIADVVDDFGADTKQKSHYVSNLARDFPIGKLANDETLAVTLSRGDGFIVAVEDPIGTAKDLQGYTRYLDDKRQKTLAKYEYALVTAQIIDAYAHSVCEQLNDSIKRGAAHASSGPQFVEPVIKSAPINVKTLTLKEAYRFLGGIIAKTHLDNSEESIVEVLKRELGISGTVSGCNTINKIAKIPNLFNDEIHNVVLSLCAFLHANSANALALFKLYENVKNDRVANAACQYFDGLIRHLNYTTLGQQALMLALEKNTDLLNPGQKREASQAADSLKTLFDSFKNFLGALSTATELTGFNVYAFDRIVLTISSEMVLAGSYQKNGKRYYKQTEVIKKIETVYRKTGIFGQDELLSERVLENTRREIKAGRKKPDAIPIELERRERLRVQDADYHALTDASQKMTGAAKLLAFSSILGFFGDESYTTEGRWANNAALGMLIAFGEYVAPEGQLAFNYVKDGQQMTLTAINKATGMQFNSAWQAARAGLFNLGSAFAGIGVLMETGNMTEAKYKGDVVDYWGAVSRGTGAGLIVISPAVLAGGLTMMTSKSWTSFALGNFLRVIGMTAPYLGLALILIGIGLSLFKKDDMELWIKYGFWGNSENYWGDAVEGYDWSEIRDEIFKDNIFDNSVFDGKAPSELASNYYKIEMQRFFSITDELKLKAKSKREIYVIHPNITDSAIAQTIQVNHKKIIGRWGQTFDVLSSPKIIFDSNTPGQAILDFHDIEAKNTQTNKIERIKDNEIVALEIEVALPRYDNATESISKFATLFMK